MKKHLIQSTLIFSGIIWACSCHKNSAPTSSSITPIYTMTAVVTKAGTATFFSTIGSQYIFATKNNNECLISANDTMNNSIVSNFTFKIGNFYDGGEFYIDSASSVTAYYETTGGSVIQTAFSIGTINVLVSGEDVSGTFNGTLTDGSVVTNGKFTSSGQGF